jgi:signal transduction histidine kinase
MIVRSLRWRLVVATAAIIAAVVVTSGLFSTVTMKRQFDQFLLEERRVEMREAYRIVRNATDLDAALRLVHARYGSRAVVLDANDNVIAFHPPEVRAYQVRVRERGIALTRIVGGRREELVLMAQPLRVSGNRRVYLLPPREGGPLGPRPFRLRSTGWLAGLTIATLIAVGVVVMFFRRVFRPVDALTSASRALASGQLDTRVPVRGDDEVAELGRAFNSMAEALERNERARRNMVSDVAHELRTPLTSIRVQVEAVQDGVVEADAKFLASIAEDAATLSRLVDDLQQLSLADAGQLRLEVEESDVGEIIDRALSGLSRAGVAIERDVAEGLIVRADARRLVQVVRNLLVNALAYANGAIRVSAARAGDRVEIRVADDGPGVADEHVERIFDRFYRADASRSRATGGAGLGLAIARQLVELHGGTIRYERPAFIVSLPS